MRLFAVLVATFVVWAPASADKKITDMMPGFERELAACERQEGGLTILLTKARALPDKAELESDLDRLDKGAAVVKAYCDEVRAMVALLKEHAGSAYKTVQKEIAARDASVRKARREGKQQINDLAPLTRKLIPIVNARVTQISERKHPGKFPSGRVVDLPQLGGTWTLGGNAVTDIAEYAASGANATVTTRPFTNATCDQQRKMFVSKAGDEPIADLELSAAAKTLDVQWAWRYVRRDQTPHMLTMMCVATGTGGFVALADQTPPDQLALADDLAKLMVTMLALQLKPAD